ncbi:MAG: epoxyqueuosine reductase QueH [Prevotella sp.]|nr:epoxyqueuosine reductase QueH [Prevotella sp.]
MLRRIEFGKPEDCNEVLLHACCAPCSSAIVEWMVANGIRPTIFYYNPNIYPREEYEIRKNESKRHAESLGLTWIDGDYDHEQWLRDVCGLEGALDPEGRFQNEMAKEPERGKRCELCFTLRLKATALKAKELGIKYFTTTLASSRWKSLEQIERAGHIAEQMVNGVTFWAQNWRKGGLYERRNQLLKEFNFYNQQYCGCEFSKRQREEFERRKSESSSH